MTDELPRVRPLRFCAFGPRVIPTRFKSISRLQRLAFASGVGGGMLLGSLLLLLSSGSPMAVASVEERYATWADARELRVLERGLLPSFAPKSATDIFVRSIPGTGQFRGSFRFPISDGPGMIAKLAVMPSQETEGSTARPTPYDAWWPRWLRGKLTAGPRGNPGYAIHRPLGPGESVENLLVACDLTKGHCLYWSDSTAQ